MSQVVRNEQLEQQILADPTDTSTYAVYADWLTEHGDVRGELIRTQLQLEDEGLAKGERTRLQREVRKLVAQQLAAWDWARDLDPRRDVRFARGFLSHPR